MKRIILCPNPYKDVGLAFTAEVKQMLEGEGFEVLVCPEYLDGDPAETEPTAVECCELADALPGAELAVSLGGDGTIMHTARRLVGQRIPIIGVNLGTVGFLAELERGEIEKLIPAAHGKFVISPRMMLKVEVLRGGKTVFSNYAMNDVFLHGFVQMIHLTARSDGRRMLEFSGDGIVIASPTGSTAYSMSAGGPLVEPEAENLIVTPICAYALAARSFVLAPERIVTVAVTDLRGKAILSADGGSFDILDGDVLRVQKSEHQTLIAHVGDKAFYDIVFEKLGGRK